MGSTRACRGLSQKGHLPAVCSINSPMRRSMDPSIARCIITGRCSPLAVCRMSEVGGTVPHSIARTSAAAENRVEWWRTDVFSGADPVCAHLSWVHRKLHLLHFFATSLLIRLRWPPMPIQVSFNTLRSPPALPDSMFPGLPCSWWGEWRAPAQTENQRYHKCAS